MMLDAIDAVELLVSHSESSCSPAAIDYYRQSQQPAQCVLTHSAVSRMVYLGNKGMGLTSCRQCVAGSMSSGTRFGCSPLWLSVSVGLLDISAFRDIIVPRDARRAGCWNAALRGEREAKVFR